MDLSRQVGLYGTGQNVEPPDTQLAAGPTYLAEADNSALSIWTKAGSLVTSADLNVFFSEPTGYRFTDPRILYDAESGRWLLSGFAFTATNDCQVYVAVSLTSDPTGSWNTYLIASETGVLADQPMTGVNSDKVVISWNDYTGSAPTFSGQETRVLQKSDLLSGVAVHMTAFSPDTTRFRIVPAQSLASTGTEWLTYDNAHCPSPSMCNAGSPAVGVVAITGTPSAGNVTWTESDPALQATTVPPSPRQPSGVPVVQDNDDRFISAVWQGGMLWVSGSDGCLPSGDTTTRSCMRLVEISTGSSPTVTQDFDGGQAGVDIYYPAVTFDSSGDLFISYSDSSPTIDPTASAVDSLVGSPTSLENPVTLASGLRSYQLGTVNRWGDYSAAAPDPSNPADIWVTAEYQASVTDAGDWGTATARVAIEPSIVSVSPNFGSIAGGLPVTITGSHFQPGPAVSFGSNSATNVVVVSSTQITVTTPAGTAAGPVNIMVSQPDGTVVTAPSAYTYTAPPSVSAVVPNIGPTTGGTSATITGTDFMAVTAVAFGTAAATTFTVNNATQISATSPAETAGPVDVTVTTGGGTSATSSADKFTFEAPGGVYTAVTPVRLLDTRNTGTTLGSGGSLNLQIAGVNGVPAGATAVVVNVTAVDQSAGGFFTVYPTGLLRPLASNLNFSAHETVPNLVTVGLGGGSITIYNGVGTANAVIDLEGYYARYGGGTAGEYVPVVPARITDTRPGSGKPNARMTLGQGAILNVQVTSAGGIPSTGVSAVVMNVTATNTSAASFFTVYPTGQARPLASNLNWTAGVTVPNRVIVPVGSWGQVSFYNGVGSADLIVDVNGYFTDSTLAGASFTALSPARLVDTRNGTGGFNSPLGQGASMVVTVAGNGGVPMMASATPPSAVVLNVTVDGPTAASDLVVWPDGASPPVASDLNFVPGQTVPNLVIVKLSAGGKIDIRNDFGSTSVIIDVVGWYG